MKTRALILTLMIVPFLILTSVAVCADTSSNVNLIVGDIETIATKDLIRLSITDPSVADVSDAQDDKIMVLGKKPGQTALFYWDKDGKHTVMVHISEQDLKALQGRIINLLDKANIKVTLEANAVEGKVVASGKLPKDQKAEFDRIIESHADQVINLVKESVNEELVQIDIQILELNTAVTKNLGIDWTNASTGDASGLLLGYDETLPSTNGKPEDYFKFGDVNRTTAFGVKVNALLKEGKGRILSKPRLVVMSGKEASFLVGGEIPVKTTTTNTTGTTENTTFKQYGVNMTVTPTIRDEKVDVLLNVEISDVDSSKPSGNDIAFITRTAQTTLFLDDKQTIVLAGLIKHNDSQQSKMIPVLGKIPVLGTLFRTNSTPTPNSDTELVIILTPRILKDKKYATKEVIMPTRKQLAFNKEIVEDYFEEEGFIKKEKKLVPAKIVVNPPVTFKAAVAEMPTMPYVRSIQMKISQAISFPYEALENNWQGTVKLKLHIQKDGTLSDALVMESSGHSVFDQDALNTAKIVAPYDPFSPEILGQELIVTVPIIYSQGSSKPNTQTTIAAY